MAANMIGSRPTYSDICKYSWRSYIMRKPQSNTFLGQLVEGLVQRKKPFLIFAHLNCQLLEEKHFASKTNHYHILTANGNPKAGSDSTYSFLKRLSDRFDTGYDCDPVRSFYGLIQYLRQKPRKLVHYHVSIHSLVMEGHFSQIASRVNPPSKPAKGTNRCTLKTSYEKIYDFVKKAKARSIRELMDWVIKDADEDDRIHITKNLYPAHDFDKLVNKVLQMIVLEHSEYSWKESLNQVRVPVSCHTSLERSKDCIERFFSFNNLNLKQEVKKIEAILDKKTTKVNSILFKGPSNSGKTLICNSLKHSFLSYAELAPGITNNFWLQPAKGKRVMFQDEEQWPEDQQDRLKLITGGQECPFSQKGLPDEMLPRTPYLAAFNTWPWARILNQAHIQAFKNRCLIYTVQKADWLADFVEEGDLNPLAWLEILQEIEEEEQLIAAQKEFEENGFDSNELLPVQGTVRTEKSVLNYFSVSELSYDGYMSSSDEWSEIEDLREKRPKWSDEHVQAQVQYYQDFDQQHPKYSGWVEDCEWYTELQKDIPDFLPSSNGEN